MRLGLKFVLLDIRSDLSENLLCLSKRILIHSFSESRLDFRFWHELSSCTGLSVLMCVKKDVNLGEDNPFPMVSSWSSASQKYECSVSMSPDSWKIIAEVSE